MTRRCRPLLGTFVEIECDNARAIEAGFYAVETVRLLMSAHDPASELSRINRLAHLEPVPVSGWTARVIERALYWSRVSAGQFDIARAGASALRRAALPLHPGQPEPDAAATWASIILEDGAVRLDRPACLDLGGIAKGFAVDRAVEAMIAAGATSGLVNAGGDLRGFGPRAWRIDVVDPLTRRPVALVDIQNVALATSAGLPSGSGLEFGHLPDSDGRWASITVQAANCGDADALTKILWSGWAGARRLLADVDARAFAIRAGGRVEEIVEEVMA